jgi:hypothetical protein
MFDPTMHLADPHNPFQGDLDRRWRRSEYLIAHGRSPSYTRDDHATWSAWRFRLGLDSCDGLAERQHLDVCFPAIAAAYDHFATPTPLKRWELEARLLANESDAAIAAKCGLSVEAVHMYGELFYDVRPRLAADTYIHLVVLDGKGHTAIAPDDYEALLKLYGYAMGGCVVDDLLEYIADPPTVPASLNGLDLAALKRLRRHLKLKLTILLRSTPASTVPVATWQRLAQDYVAARHGTQGREDNEADVLCSLRATLGVMALLSDSVQAGVDAETLSMSTIEPACESVVHLLGGDTGSDARATARVKAVPA